MIKFVDKNGNNVFEMDDKGDLTFKDKKKEEEYNNIKDNKDDEE